MGRELPTDLCAAHQDVLEQFRAGHLTAGQLTERLEQVRSRHGVDAPTAEMAAVKPVRAARRRLKRVATTVALVALATVSGVAAGIEIGSRAQPVAAQTPPSAHVARAAR